MCSRGSSLRRRWGRLAQRQCLREPACIGQLPDSRRRGFAAYSHARPRRRLLFYGLGGRCAAGVGDAFRPGISPRCGLRLPIAGPSGGIEPRRIPRRGSGAFAGAYYHHPSSTRARRRPPTMYGARSGVKYMRTFRQKTISMAFVSFKEDGYNILLQIQILRRRPLSVSPGRILGPAVFF